jgi:DNA-binding protein HU-beta
LPRPTEEDKRVNKNELVDQVAGRAGLPRAGAAGAIEAALAAIEQELAAGGEVSITGFGKFSVSERSARQARNPRTGEPIEVPAGRAPRFTAGAKLKQAVAQ